MVKRLLVLCGLVALLVVPVATAATPSVTVNPSSPTVTQSYTISGCGYAASAALVVVVSDQWSRVQSQNVTADGVGCFVSTWVAAAVSGYRVDVYSVRRNGKSLLWQAGSEFAVLPL